MPNTNTTLQINESLDSAFEQNLCAYLEANNTSNPSDFKVKRELNIARHALEESLALHNVVCNLIKRAINNLGQSQEDTYKLVQLANNLEERHRKLQSSAKVVASIAKNGAEIESLLASKLDAAQVYSIIVQLPQLILTILNSHISDSGIRQRIAEEFNEELERNVNVLTYSKTEGASAPQGVIEEQVVAMLNTVPTGVVEPNSEESQCLQH